MSDLVLVELISVIAVGIAVSGTWWLIRRSNENRHALGRWAGRAQTFLNLNAIQYVRAMIPMYIFLGCVGIACGIGYPIIVAAEDGSGDGLAYWVAIGSPLLIAGAALQIAITLRTGRPRALVLPSCRNMSQREVERWLDVGEHRVIANPMNEELHDVAGEGSSSRNASSAHVVDEGRN